MLAHRMASVIYDASSANDEETAREDSLLSAPFFLPLTLGLLNPISLPPAFFSTASYKEKGSQECESCRARY